MQKAKHLIVLAVIACSSYAWAVQEVPGEALSVAQQATPNISLQAAIQTVQKTYPGNIHSVRIRHWPIGSAWLVRTTDKDGQCRLVTVNAQNGKIEQAEKITRNQTTQRPTRDGCYGHEGRHVDRHGYHHGFAVPQ